ncbi:MAG TPA: hypothetical protein VMT30_05170 [Candidatus Saccharimonadia bacterium]|nr:hypothetical protein [Candidatus Saccharimonadia bacterium]
MQLRIHDNGGGLTITKLVKRFFGFLIVGVLLGLGCVVFLSRSALAEQADAWHLVPRPQRFTELYFADYLRLSTAPKPGSTQTVAFTVHNLEHRSTAYRYELTSLAADEQTGKTLGSGSIMLAHGQSKVTEQVIAVPSPRKRTLIKVSLSYEGIAFGDSRPTPQTQSIHYWVEATRAVLSDKVHHATK